MEQHLFEIIFSDGTIFSGGNLQETKWKDIPKDKQISRLFYLLPSGDYLALGNYDKYYQYIECTQDIYNGDGKINIEYVYLLGKLGNKINQYKIDLQTGSIGRKELKEEDVHVNSEFWR